MYQRKKPLPTKRGGTYHIQSKRYDAVTNALKAFNKPGLVVWGMREAAKVGTANPSLSIEGVISAVYQQRDTAGNIGTMLHHIAEDKVSGKKIDIDKLTPSLQPYVKALLKFFDEIKPKIIHTEVIIFNTKHGFAGTLDLMATLHDNSVWILDYKTGKNIYPENGLQQVAYKNGTHLKKKDGTIIPMPKVHKTGIIHLKKNATFSLIEVDEPFDVFIHILETYRWATGHGLL